MAPRDRIRHAVPADIPAMMKLAHASLHAAHWSQAQYEQLLAEDASGEPRSVRLILVFERAIEYPPAGQHFQRSEQQSGIAGCLVAHQIDREWELENIVVAEGTRRCGIGRRLLMQFIERVRAESGTLIFLEVRESNRAARALYENAGFERVGVRKNYYSDPTEDAVLYRLTVS